MQYFFFIYVNYDNSSFLSMQIIYKWNKLFLASTELYGKNQEWNRNKYNINLTMFFFISYYVHCT